MEFQHGWAAVAFAAALMAGANAVADDAADSSKKAQLDAVQVERGRQLYSARCSHCHGLNMITGGNVTYDLREFPRDQEQRFFGSVTNGKSNRMPPWGDVLTQEEIGDIWMYVLSRSKS